MSRAATLAGGLVASLAALVTISGCQALGVIASKLGGQPDVPAEYAPDKTRPLLVIAENFRSPTAVRADADQLAKLVSDALAQEKVAPMIDADRVAVVRDAHPDDFDKMSVVDVARAAGARQVIYIDLNAVGVGVQPGSDLLKGVASAHVSVIDVDLGRAVYPGETGGVVVGFSTPMRNAGDHANVDSVRSETLLGLSGNISRLFHKWKPEDNQPQSDLE